MVLGFELGLKWFVSKNKRGRAGRGCGNEGVWVGLVGSEGVRLWYISVVSFKCISAGLCVRTSAAVKEVCHIIYQKLPRFFGKHKTCLDETGLRCLYKFLPDMFEEIEG